MDLSSRIQKSWQSINLVSILLLPLTLIFTFVAKSKRLLYKVGLLKTMPSAVPVIVVGNINIGGVGKTPLVIWLVSYLKEHGYNPAVVSRGYGGNCDSYPTIVDSDSDACRVGDEPFLIFKQTNAKVVVDPDRARAVAEAAKDSEVNIVISDDGLQHYKMQRHAEILVVDSKKQFGNGLCLPSGPLREPVARISTVDLVVESKSGTQNKPAYQVELGRPRRIADDIEFAWDDIGPEVEAAAGIAQPDLFFDQIERHGKKVNRHPFPDHFAFDLSALNFDNDKPVLVTAKDAVKLKGNIPLNFYYCPLILSPNDALIGGVVALLNKLN